MTLGGSVAHLRLVVGRVGRVFLSVWVGEESRVPDGGLALVGHQELSASETGSSWMKIVTTLHT